jgi:hypothetical protein
LHHEAKIQSLPAVKKIVFFTTNERKSMSTKTTLKRIALVAVSALGLGLFATVTPAQAAGDPTFSVNTTSITVVSSATAGNASAGDSTTASKSLAVVRICASDADGVRPLASGETITASVVGVPTSVTATKSVAANSTDIGFIELKYSGATDRTESTGGITYAKDDNNGTSVLFKTVATATQTTQVTMAAGDTGNNTNLDGRIGTRNTAYSDSSTSAVLGSAYFNCYLLGMHGFGNVAVDQGAYTVRLSMNDSANFITKTQDITVKYVSSAADSGAAITITNTGRITKGAAFSYTTLNNSRATLTNGTAGGLIQVTGSADLEVTCPVLSIAIIDQDDAVLTSTGLDISDTGTAGIDHVASSSDSATVAQNTLQNSYCNGTYGIVSNGYTGTFDAAYTNNQTSGNSTSFRVRYGSTTATAAFTVVNETSAVTGSSTVSVTATGAQATNTSLNTGYMDYANHTTLPLTTKSAVIKVRAMASSTVAVQDYPLIFTVTWTNAASGEVTPRSGSTYATTVRTDNDGYASLTLTNNSPIDGAQAAVAVTGFTATAASQYIKWAKSQPASVTSSPASTFSAKTGSTVTVTWTFSDTFGAPVVGETIDLSIAGANSATSTVVIPSAVTNASGQVSYTFTDAAGVEASSTLGTTTLTATSRTVSSVTNSRIITWKTTVPVIATLTGYYNDYEGTTIATPVPSTAMYDTASAGTKYLIRTSANLTRTNVIAGDQSDQVGFEYIAKDSAGALVSGVPVTVSTSDGLWVLSSLGLPVTSRTIYPTSGGVVAFTLMGTKTGTHTLTVTAGTVSSTATLVYGNVEADARYLTLSANASGVANAETLPSITATVTDRWGNPVSGVDLTVIHTGVGRLAGGSKSVTFTTDATGAYVIEGSSTLAGTASIKVTATATSGQMSDVAGYVGTTELIDAITAGNDEATGTFTFSAGSSAATSAAEAATDAAAEAIDAANAATDAANLAAEAADAATVAAEEARDAADAATAAVEELATQVATLMAALKAQITTLANTVAKIAKKVKA